ncbi:hypothetical protein LNN31_07710 [Acetobacterium wieringae]|jgi:hypothetical protein|uniref:DUF3789 domain-containing protein n=2 Tax=Acetobacterium wieringae TaxID=52694 RepID=A0ABY6HLJ8_9FIRM|nr:hypothetical protein [Acetobacterium wieringae]UYO64294.1 hypothetical protein LNN31_07710 [Acetobacterium wieringae]VUZ27008.1 Uncharacterised protein [Acetobacterium wieringae]
MTTVQSLMLAFCFGSVMGYLLADVIYLICSAVKKFKKKKEDSAEKEE